MMYSFSVTRQLIVFIQSVSFGMLSGFSRSVFYFAAGLITLRKKPRYYISDILFGIFMMFSAFCFFLAYNLGTVRFHLIMGIFFGAVIYSLSFGQTVDFIFDKLLVATRKAFCIFMKPIILLYAKINEIICKKTNKKSSERIANKNKNVV